MKLSKKYWFAILVPLVVFIIPIFIDVSNVFEYNPNVLMIGGMILFIIALAFMENDRKLPAIFIASCFTGWVINWILLIFAPEFIASFSFSFV